MSDRLKTEAKSPADKLRLNSLSGKLASAAFAVIPYASTLQLKPSHFRIAARLRLGLSPSADMPTHCACPAVPPVLLSDNLLHLSHCKRFAPNFVIQRHNEVVDCIARAARRVGASARVEPRKLRFAADDRRPDIDVYLGADRFLVDASIRIPQPGDDALEATRLASRKKHDRYDAQAKAVKATVIPFIVETFGAWGDEALRFAKTLKRHVAAQFGGDDDAAREFYYHFCSELAVAVQRGNARVFETALQAARSSSDVELPCPRSVVQVPGSNSLVVHALVR